MEEVLIISVKPKYAKKILSGNKTIELRKCSPQRVSENNYVVLYVTNPIMEIWGIYKIKNILSDEVDLFWNKYNKNLGVSKNEYYSYYINSKKAFGIELEEVKKLDEYSIKLIDIKKMIPSFSPPQTYKYFKKQIFSFGMLKSILTQPN